MFLCFAHTKLKKKITRSETKKKEKKREKDRNKQTQSAEPNEMIEKRAKKKNRAKPNPTVPETVRFALLRNPPFRAAAAAPVAVGDSPVTEHHRSVRSLGSRI